MATAAVFEKARDALDRVQQFDVKSLSREADLGKQMGFSEAVAPAESLVNLYKRLPL